MPMSFMRVKPIGGMLLLPRARESHSWWSARICFSLCYICASNQILFCCSSQLRRLHLAMYSV